MTCVQKVSRFMLMQIMFVFMVGWNICWCCIGNLIKMFNISFFHHVKLYHKVRYFTTLCSLGLLQFIHDIYKLLKNNLSWKWKKKMFLLNQFVSLKKWQWWPYQYNIFPQSFPHEKLAHWNMCITWFFIIHFNKWTSTHV